MELVVTRTVDAAIDLVASTLAEQVREAPASVLGLATGRTMDRVYAELVRAHRERALDFGRCRTFNLDEYVGLAADDPRSFRAYMDAHLFSQVNIDCARIDLPDGMAVDPDVECRRYEAAIEAAGGIALQLLGIGENGHIGFNEPGSLLQSRTRRSTLAAETRQQNAAMFGGEASAVPSFALTMGLGTILDTQRVVLLATGASKAAALAAAIEGPVTPDVPASALQLHPRCLIVADAAAARALRRHPAP